MLSLFHKACPRTLGAEIDNLSPAVSGDAGLKSVFEFLMTLSSKRREAALREALETAQANMGSDSIWHWVIKLARFYPGDIGILSPLYLNLICLSPGQAIYLPAGRMHAYLEGTGLELMANSDNVLRGGLTPKHVDVDELIQTLHFESTPVDPLRPQRPGPCVEVYTTPAIEFSLTRIAVDGSLSYRDRSSAGARIVLCIKGVMTATAHETGETIEMKKGTSVFVSGSVTDLTLGGNGTCYAAMVTPKENRS